MVSHFDTQKILIVEVRIGYKEFFFALFNLWCVVYLNVNNDKKVNIYKGRNIFENILVETDLRNFGNQLPKTLQNQNLHGEERKDWND